jgi:hypothetical protein
MPMFAHPVVAIIFGVFIVCAETCQHVGDIVAPSGFQRARYGDSLRTPHRERAGVIRHACRRSVVRREVAVTHRALKNPRSDVVNNELVRAIVDKRLVEFVYKAGGPRIVEPHDYGIRHGVESLLGFQIGGESQSGTRHGWKQFDVEQMFHLRVLERRFAGTRADSAQHHRTWDTLFARVT